MGTQKPILVSYESMFATSIVRYMYVALATFACAAVLASCSSTPPAVDVSKLSAKAIGALVVRDLQARPFVSFSTVNSPYTSVTETISKTGDLAATVHFDIGGTLNYRFVHKIQYGKFDTSIAKFDAAHAIRRIFGQQLPRADIARLQPEITSAARKLANHWLRGTSIFDDSLLAQFSESIWASNIPTYKVFWFELLKYPSFKKRGPVRFHGHNVMELYAGLNPSNSYIYFVSMGSNPLPVGMTIPHVMFPGDYGPTTFLISWPLHVSIEVPRDVVKPCTLLTPSDKKGDLILGNFDTNGSGLTC